MEYTVFILALPLAMFLLLGLLDSKLKPRVAGILGTMGMTVCTVLAYLTAYQFFTQPRNAEGVIPSQVPYNFEWLRFTEHLHIDLGIYLDPISVMMLVVITTVSLMVHIYSLGYMHGE
ncbi:MAG: NADH-quinone oxidoreductase subunit L, partial [Bacteroidales bacterium]|nr:NADH-quinone oxidoreductase subunit L [Bacteroidales bacterium]